MTTRAEVPFDELDDDRPHVRVRQARRDKQAQRAYDAGRKGRGFSADTNSEVPVAELREHHRRGAADRDNAEPRTRELPSDETADEPAVPPTAARGTPSRAAAWGRPNAPQFVNDGAGFLLGLLGYALFINFVRGGSAQARAWIAAKFLNRPYGQAPSGATVIPGGAGVPKNTPSSAVPRNTPSSTPPVTTPAVPIPYHPTPPPAPPSPPVVYV